MIFRERNNHKVPGLNTTSTADISFMLLIFFLVTSSMDVDKGLNRKLPPVDKTQKMEETVIDKGNMLSLKITSGDTLLVDGKPFNVNGLSQRLSKFIISRGKKHLISIDVDPKAKYEAYFLMQNQIVTAYKDVQNYTAQRLYHHAFDLCSQKQKEAIQKACKQHIAETYKTAANNFIPQSAGTQQANTQQPRQFTNIGPSPILDVNKGGKK